MAIIKKLITGITGIPPLKWLNSINATQVLLPYHHVVSDEYLPHIRGLYPYKNKKQFSADLDLLLKYRKPLHPETLAQCITERRPFPKNTFLLTFDDGFREIYDVVAPMLLAKGLPAIFFINPAFIDNRELFYRCKLGLVIEALKQNNPDLNKKIATHLSTTDTSFDSLRSAILQLHYPDRDKANALGALAGISFDEYLDQQKPFLTSEEVSQLYQQGFTIGAHSVDHPHFKYLTEDEQLLQARDSISQVQQWAPGKYSYFSFPHQDGAVRQSFFERLLAGDPNTILFGVQNLLDEKENQVLHRFNAENPGKPFTSVLKLVLLYRYAMGKMGRARIIRS